MPKASPSYTSFTAGELTPLINGRTDLDQYFKGSKQAKNMLVTQYGPIVNRPGTEFVAEVKTSSKATRLIGSTSSSLGDFVIEMGDVYMRFYNSDGFIIGSEIVSPFLEAELFEVQYAQLGEVITFTHKSHRPQKLTRTGAGTWAIADYDFVPPPFQLQNANIFRVIRAELTTSSPTGFALGEFITLISSTVSLTLDNYYQIGVPTGSPEKQGFVKIIGTNSHDFTSTVSPGPGTVTLSGTTGSITATVGSTYFTSAMISKTIKAFNGDHNPSTGVALCTIDSLVGSSPSTTVNCTVTADFDVTSYIGGRWAISDTNVVEAVVSSALSLSEGDETSVWAEPAWEDSTGWPARCAFVGKKLALARTDTVKVGYWLSKPFEFDNFDTGTGLKDDAIREALPESNEIMWLLGGRRLVIGTDSGDFSVSGESSALITPSNLEASKQTHWGSEPIVPANIGSFGYYVQEKGRKLRELSYSFQEDAYLAPDMTAVSEHLTKSGIKEIAYQRNPFSILYCVLNDGKMAVMTREADQDALGWTPLDTDGQFESVAVIPHATQDYDIAYVIVNRTIGGVTKRYIERFADPQIPERQDLCMFVDSGLMFNAYEDTTGDTLSLSGTTGTVTATAGSAVFNAGDVGQRIRAIDAAGVTLGELNITVFTDTTHVDGVVTRDFSTTSYDDDKWGVSATTISGLSHLEAETVKILADGGTTTDKVVSSGAITLDTARGSFVVSVGLGYVSRWENMPIESGSATGTSQGKLKRIYQCGLKFYRSLGMQVGQDIDHLNDIILRSISTPLGSVEPLFTGLVPPFQIDSTFDYEGHIVLQQDKPLPMMILSVLPLLETNDK